MFARLIFIIVLLIPATRSMGDERVDAAHMSEEEPKARLAISSDGMWRPIVGGISRFSLQFPEIALAEAQRFQDTSTLFYLSNKVDNGLELHSLPHSSFDLTVALQETWAHYYINANPNVSYGLGVKSSKNSTYPAVSFRYRQIPDNLVLYAYALNILENDIRFALSRTKLSPTEGYEDLFHLETRSLLGDTNAAVGRRWFKSLGQFDSVLSLSHFENQSSVELQIEQNYENHDIYFGTRTALSGTNSELFLGFKANLGPGVTTRVVSGNETTINKAASLRKLRRVNLDKLWRRADILK